MRIKLFAFKGRANRLVHVFGIAAVHTDAVRRALTAFVVHAFFRVAFNRHMAVGSFVAHVVGSAFRNFRKRSAAGFVAGAGFFAVHFNFRTAAALILVAGAVDHVAFQFSHRLTSFPCLII